jgi:hypothetical protein
MQRYYSDYDRMNYAHSSKHLLASQRHDLRALASTFASAAALNRRALRREPQHPQSRPHDPVMLYARRSAAVSLHRAALLMFRLECVAQIEMRDLLSQFYARFCRTAVVNARPHARVDNLFE